VSSLAPKWPSATLGDLCEIAIGRTPRRDSPEYWHGSLPWVTISDLNDGLVTETRECISSLGAVASGAPLLKAGTLLFSFKLTIGKMAVAGVDVFTNEAVAGLIPRNPSQVTTEYLRFALAAADVSQGSSHAVKGRTLNLPLLRAIRIPLPPLSDQNAIAVRLSQQLAAAARMRAAAETLGGEMKALAEAHIRKTFESPACSAAPATTIGDVASLVIDGPHVTPTYVDQGVPFVTVRNIAKRVIDLTETSFITAEDHARFSSRGRADVGDILYTKDGTLGIPCLVQEAHEFSFFVSVALIKLRRDLVDPRDVTYALDSPSVRSQVGTLAAGAGLKHMVLKSIRSLSIPFPSLETQRLLVAELSDRLRRTHALAEVIGEQAALGAQLPPALLRHAFSGGL